MDSTQATPSPSAAASAAVPHPRQLLKQLQEQFPVFRDHLPLMVGINKQIAERVPGIDKKLLRTALGIHANSMAYLKVLEKAQQRFDLDGNVAGEVTEEHRAHAALLRRERFEKIAERKKAERVEQKRQEQEDAAERRRTEKLQQLAEKFSRK